MIVYYTPNCQQCRITKKMMSENDIHFEEVNLNEDPEARARVRAWGYLTAPVVEAPDGSHWSGFRPDRIKEYANAPLGLQGR